MTAPADEIDWSSLSHAYGAATDVPAWLRDLQDPERAETALDGLDNSIFHQGSVYSATAPALSALVALGCDPTTPNRGALLDFIASVAEALAWTDTTGDLLGRRGRRLPPDTDLDEFDRSGKAAVADACARIAPCLDDAEAVVRAGAARVLRALHPLPAPLVEALRRRLPAERDPTAAAAVAATLAQAGLLGEAERGTLAKACPAAQFAAACAALRSKHPIDGRDLATATDPWLNCAADADLSGPFELMKGLVAARGAALLPLLDDLAERPDVFAREAAIVGLVALSDLSRRATDAALDGLARIAATFSTPFDSGTAPRIDREAIARKKLADGLRGLAAIDKRDGRGRVADALVTLARADPDALRDEVAETLHDLGDARWLDLAALAPASPHLYELALRAVIKDSKATADSAALKEALDHLRGALRRDPPGASSLVWQLLDVPDEAARVLLPEVIACLPFATRPACDLLARWKATDAVASLRESLAEVEPENRCWVHAALAQLTGDASELDRGWAVRPERFFDEEGYLARWAAMPTDLFLAVCRAKLTGVAMTAIPHRDDQLYACGLLVPIDGLASVWPTLRALADQGEPWTRAAIEIVEAAFHRASNRKIHDDLADLLEDIRVTGRRNWFGNDLDAAVEAAIGLRAIGIGARMSLAETCMTAVRIAPDAQFRTSTLSRACTLLVELAADDAAIRQCARLCFDAALASDRRIVLRGGGGIVAKDEAFQDMVRRAAAML